MGKAKTVEITENVTAQRDSSGHFLKGNKIGFQPGECSNPGGATKEAWQVKKDIISCFESDKFQAWAKENEADFYQMVIKLLPKELHSTGTPGIHITVTHTELEEKERANNRLLDQLNN